MPDKEQVNARLPAYVHGPLVKHAESTHVTPSEYLALIAKQWFANGCPPVTPEEAALRAQNGRPAASGKRR